MLCIFKAVSGVLPPRSVLFSNKQTCNARMMICVMNDEGRMKQQCIEQ